MDISVLLSTFKRPTMLASTLSSFCELQDGGLQWEVIVVDNGDNEETKAVARRFAEKLQLRLLVEPRPGKNRALNRALPEGRGELFLFTDDDVAPEPSWLVEIWQGAKRWPDHSVFGGKILPAFPEGRKPQFEHPFFVGAFAIADWDLLEGEYKAHQVWGPNMAIRADLFRDGWQFNPEVGPDGTANYISGSETELTNRLEASGFKAIYLPGSLVYHHIREEQLTDRYYYKRALRLGQQFAFEDYTPAHRLLFGVPKYLLQRLFETWKDRWSLEFADDGRARFDKKIEYWQTLGAINWYRKRRLPP